MALKITFSSPAAVAEGIRVALEARREWINRELCTFPTPIPGCDVSFNRLLEERARVVDELQQLSRMGLRKEAAGELLAYLRANTSLDEAAKAEFELALTAAANPHRLPLSSIS